MPSPRFRFESLCPNRKVVCASLASGGNPPIFKRLSCLDLLYVGIIAPHIISFKLSRKFTVLAKKLYAEKTAIVALHFDTKKVMLRTAFASKTNTIPVLFPPVQKNAKLGIPIRTLLIGSTPVAHVVNRHRLFFKAVSSFDGIIQRKIVC